MMQLFGPPCIRYTHIASRPVSHHSHIHERFVENLRHISDAERLSCLDETVKIKTRVATEPSPHSVREVESERLDEQYQRHPLVVRQSFRLAPLIGGQSRVGRYVGIERQEIRVTYPTETTPHQQPTSTACVYCHTCSKDHA